MASLSKSTLKQYNTYLKQWWDFCVSKNTLPYQPSVDTLLQFLQHKLDAGASYSSLGSARSAISLLSDRTTANIGEDKLIARFIRGVSRIRPPHPKYKTTWDPSIMLDYIVKLEPLESLSLEVLSQKLICLLALATGQRMQTLNAISLDNIVEKENLMEIYISDILKSSKPGVYQPILRLPCINSMPEVCPVRTIKYYIKLTNEFRRSDNQKLFLSCSRSHLPVTTQTLSRWVHNLMSKCGIDTSKFHSHSTRHASTSSAARLGVNINQIFECAGWTDSSHVFYKYYNRKIDDCTDFAKRVLLQK